MADLSQWNRSGRKRGLAGRLALTFLLLLAAGCGSLPDRRTDGVKFVAPPGEPLQHDATLENSRLKLAVERTTGIMTVTDKRNGHVWRGTANTAEAALHDIAGDYKGHVVSPFIVEYQDVEANVNTFKRGNLQSEQPEVQLYQEGDVVEVAFSLKEGDLRFSFRLALSGASVIVDVPGERILDNPKKAELKSLTPYPFLGAVLGKSKSGYMLVPSGPGYLIDFYDQNYPYDRAFSENIYGEDLGFDLGPGSPVPVRYPVFGIKRDDGAFVAVVGKGGVYGKLTTTPSGLYTPYNWAAAEFAYLPDDYLKNPYSARAKQRIEDEVKRLDRRITYMFLAGDDANYVGMGKTYRSFLMENEGARKLVSSGKEDPFAITIYQANGEAGLLGRKAVPVTTFDQAQEMLRSLHDRGVRSMIAALRGWNDGGDDPGNWPKRFPPDPTLGTEDDLKRLAGYARSIDTPLLLYDNGFDAEAKKAGFRPREDAQRNIRTGVVERKGDPLSLNSFSRYRLRPERSISYLRDSVPVYNEWGVSGLVLYSRHTESMLHSDFGKDGATNREQSAGVQRELLDTVGRELGFSGFAAPNAYAVGHAAYLQNFPIGPGYDVLQGRTVPFYPIAVHGLAGYSGGEANLFPDPRTDRLRHIEYGALPSYILTHDPASELQYTSSRSTLVSSSFDIWKDDIVREYEKYRDSIGSSMHLFIVDHRQLDRETYATTYEDGRQVVVNYSDRPYRYAGMDIPPYDYVVVPVGFAAAQGERGDSR